MPKTTITDPNGRVTTIRKSGCGCGAILAVLLLVYVIAAPAESFPLWGKVLAYMFEGAIVVGVLWAWGSGKVAWSNGRFETRSNVKDSGPAESVNAAGEYASNDRLSEHLQHCERCEQDLPCDEWETLFAATQKSSPKSSSKRRSSAPAEDPIEQIKRLGELHAAGVLTDEEFSAKKAELLART